MSDKTSGRSLNFYGKRKKSINEIRFENKILKTEELYKNKPLLRSFQPSGFKSNVWKPFFKLADAIDYADRYKDDLRIFAFESPMYEKHTGKRKYISTSLECFWHYYSQLSLKNRQHYEVITEDSPCKMYFDLEYSKLENPCLSEPIILENFLKFLIEKVNETFRIEILEENIILLDASTETKFSHHVIIDQENLIFINNVELGFFIKNILGEHIQDLAKKTINYGKFIVRKSSEDTCLFIDLGVYNKNRNFRLFLSEKLDKNNPFLVSKFSKNSFKDEKDTFFRSLICQEKEKREKYLRFSDPNQLENSSCVVMKKTPKASNSSEVVSTVSKYPDVDAYIADAWSKKTQYTIETEFSKAIFFRERNIIIYDVKKNKYCEHMQREHKSNGIILVADLDRKIFYQKCHDPDCRLINYKSNEYPLPEYTYKNVPDIDDNEMQEFGEICDYLHFFSDEDDDY